MDAFPVRATEAEVREHIVRFVGGTTAVTKVFGKGVSVAYSATGVVVLTWNENPGVFLGATFGFQATTHAGVKSFVAVAGAYNATAFSLTLNLFESGTLADLAALEWLTVRVAFKETGV